MVEGDDTWDPGDSINPLLTPSEVFNMHYEQSRVLMMPHEYCIMGTTSWMLMTPHEYCITSTDDASWVPWMPHKYSWCIMSTYDSPWVLLTQTVSFSDKQSGNRFVTRWQAIQVRISTRQISISFRHAPLTMSCGSLLPDVVVVSILFQEHPRRLKEYPGTTEDLQGPFRRYIMMKWLFKNSPNHEQSTFEDCLCQCLLNLYLSVYKVKPTKK